jgi:hypothetical protein
MIHKLFLAAGLLLGPGLLLGADVNYPVSSIPAALKEKAHAVVRMHQTTFTVKNLGEATHKVRYAVTLLNEQAKSHASLEVHYNKQLSRVNYIEGTLYDAAGKAIERVKRSEIVDVSAVSDFSLFEDSRVKIAKFKHTLYPCTVEFEYEETTNNLLFYPRWFPQEGPHVAVEQASFQVLMPPGADLRYAEKNLSGTKALIQTTPAGKTYAWEVKNVAALEREFLSPSYSEWLPVVYTGPTEFEMGGIKGNMSTWEGLGKWDYELNANRDVLPEEARQRVVQLTAGIKDPAEKTRKVYDYLQSHTRYVSIQLGVGGWQTFEAKTVADKGYGDCKALTNYTKSLLKAAGVEAYVALVMAGEDAPPTPANFPSSHFNHVILCVPLPKDTVWLECTSQTTPFNYLGSFTGDRYVLLATPKGGKLVKTPAYKAVDNLQRRRIEVTLDANGDATAEAVSVYTGLQQDPISPALHSLSPEDQKKWLYKRINIPSFEINKFSFTEEKSRIPAVTEKLSLTIRKCASKSGTRVFLAPNLMSGWSQVPPAVENRRTEVEWDMDFIDTDTVTYYLPKGFGVEFLPEKVEFSSRFGSYSASATATDDVLTYTRRISMKKGRYPAASYPELLEFYRKVVKADKMQVVFVNKGT